MLFRSTPGSGQFLAVEAAEETEKTTAEIEVTSSIINVIDARDELKEEMETNDGIQTDELFSDDENGKNMKSQTEPPAELPATVEIERLSTSLSHQTSTTEAVSPINSTPKAKPRKIQIENIVGSPTLVSPVMSPSHSGIVNKPIERDISFSDLIALRKKQIREMKRVKNDVASRLLQERDMENYASLRSWGLSEFSEGF